MTYHFPEETPGQNHGTVLNPHVGKHILASEYVSTHGNRQVLGFPIIRAVSAGDNEREMNIKKKTK